MALDFGRGHGVGEVTIDEDKCTVCGLCVQVCRGAPLFIEENRVKVDQTRLFGCIACGQCAAVCPTGAIGVEGRDLHKEDLFQLAPQSERANFSQFNALLQARRSVRDFQDREVEPEVIQSIIDAASTSPMGVPPSEVGITVLVGREKVKELKDALLFDVKKMKPFISNFSFALMRPFMSKEDYAGMKTFIKPVFDFYLEDAKSGRDWFLYDAPLAMCFYASAFADPGDVYVAATTAMLAGHALGLGSCMLGFPMYFVRFDKILRQKLHISGSIRGGLTVIFGYPAVKYHRGIKRRFAHVEVLK